MREHRAISRTQIINLVVAFFPIAFGVYLGIGLFRNFSAIDEILYAPKPKPARRIVPLPGRPPKGEDLPPARTVAIRGGYGAVVEWLRPLHRAAVEKSDQAPPPWAGRPGLGSRRTIYVRSIGDFTPAQRRVADLEAELLATYFGLQVRSLPEIPVDTTWPEEALRPDERWGEDQLLAPYIVDELLAPERPDDAAAVLGITARDLWSGDAWSYTLGETRVAARVGVWSLYRIGDSTGDEDERRQVLRTALATATREVGRMLGLSHESAYGCNLRGSGMVDADRDGDPPSWLCPTCETDLLAATGVDPVWRYERLVDFYRENDLGEEEWFYERSLYAVRHIEGLAPVWAPGKSHTHDLHECR